MKVDSIVGFSINPELVVTYDEFAPDVKVPARSFDCLIGGTSACVAGAMQKLGRSARLLAAVGKDPDDPMRVLLEAMLRKQGRIYTLLPVRPVTSVAIQPILTTDNGHGRVIGLKRPISGCSQETLDQVTAVVRAQPDVWRVATGVLPDEQEIVFALFNGRQQSCVLNPNIRLMQDRRAADPILAHTGILVCNDAEFAAYFGGDTSLSDSQFEFLHKQGPELIVVTRNSKGASVWFRGQRHDIAPRNFGECVSEVGAGDWWLAAFLSRLSDWEIHEVAHISPEYLEISAGYAALVAGIKVTLPGASNGPSLDEVNAWLAQRVL